MIKKQMRGREHAVSLINLLECAEIESSWFGVILRYAWEGRGSRLAYI